MKHPNLDLISLLCPTRARPDNMQRLWDSARETANSPENLEIIFYIDKDDIVSQDKAQEMKVPYMVGERIVLSQMWNECYRVSGGDILMHCGDDIIFRTNDWDKYVKDAFKEYPDGILFVYGRDGYSPNTFGTHGFIGRNWVEAVGHFVPPYFSSDMNDTWLNDVSEMIGRKKFIPEIYTEHMHPINGKAEWDITHQERLARGQRDDVINLYKLKEAERRADADKLLKFINGYGKQVSGDFNN